MYPIYFSLSLDRQSYLSRDESNRINGLTKDGLFCSDTVSVIPILNTYNDFPLSFDPLSGRAHLPYDKQNHLSLDSKIIRLSVYHVYSP